MTQKQRTLALLSGALLAAGVLIGLAYKGDRDEQRKQQSEEQQAKLFDLDPAAVTVLKLTAKGQTTELSKQGEAWRLTAPVSAPAEKAAVDAVLGRLATIRKKQTVEEKPADLAKYGLDKPEIEVVATTHAGSLTLSLGAENAFNSTQYARRSGSEAVLLVEGGNVASLAKTPFDLREKRVALFDPAQVGAVTVRTPEGRYVLTQANGGWRMTEPQAMRADDTAVGNLLSSLGGIRATAIPEEKPTDLARYGLDKPAYEAELTLPSAKLTVRFGAPVAGKLYAQTSDSEAVYEVAANAPEVLKQTPQTLEDKTVLRFATDDVGAMTFTTPTGATVLLQRKRTPLADGGAPLEGWAELSPKQGEGKLWKASGIMHNLSNLRAAAIETAAAVDLKNFGLEPPRKKAVIQTAKGEPLAELWVGGEKEGNVFVKTPKDPRIFLVERFKVADLPDNADDLLLAPPADAGAPTAP